jgi:hypothetical protein
MYAEPEPAITGLEIVRSSTAPFARAYLKELAWDLVNGAEHENMRLKMAEIKTDFYDHIDNGDIYPISKPSGIGKDPPAIEEAMYAKGLHYLIPAASLWNHLIRTDPILSKGGYEPIMKGSKVKTLDISPVNPWKAKFIAYNDKRAVDRLLDIFQVDWDMTFDKVIANTAGTFFEKVGWKKNIISDNTYDLDVFD